MWMIKNFVGGLTWICRDKQEHEKINVEIEFKWDVVCYHCQNEIPGNISRSVQMVTYTDSSSAYSSSDMVQKLWRGEWLSRHWGDQESEESVLLLAPVSFITATSAHPPAAPSLTWPGQGSSSPWFIYTQGEIWWHTLPFLLIVSTSISTMYVWVWDSNHCTGLKPESHWGKRENQKTEKNLWMYEIDILFIMSLSFFERWDRSKYFSWST